MRSDTELGWRATSNGAFSRAFRGRQSGDLEVRCVAELFIRKAGDEEAVFEMVVRALAIGGLMSISSLWRRQR